VVEHIWREHGPETEILFGPDMWLGSFVARETGLTDDPERYARFHVWDGECHVHAGSGRATSAGRGPSIRRRNS
jgi:quinolinate synthase